MAVFFSSNTGLASPISSEPEIPVVSNRSSSHIEVTGNRSDQLQKNIGTNTKITEKELGQVNAISTSEVLRGVPGVSIRQEDAMGLRLNIGMRGLSPTRSRLVLTLEDGVPVTVSPYGEPELYFSTPIERVQSLDVLKGSNSLLYGPQTLGGVVHFHTFQPPSQREWFTQLEYGQRSYGKVLARYGDSQGDVQYVVQAMRKQGDGFRNMPFGATDVMSTIAFATSTKGEAKLKFAVYDEFSKTTYVGLTQPLYAADPRRDTIAPTDLFKIRRYESSFTHSYRFNEFTKLKTLVFANITKLDFQQQDFDRERISNINYVRTEGDVRLPQGALFFRSTNAIREREYTLLGVEPTLEHQFKTGHVQHTTIVGGRAMLDHARRRQSQGDFATSFAGALQRDDTTSILGLSAYVQHRILLHKNLLLTPALRFEQASSRKRVDRALDSNGIPQDSNLTGTSSAYGFMPGIGMVWGSSEFNLFAEFHTGYSPPRISVSITPEGRDAQLNAERSLNYEIGAHARIAKYLRFEVSGFWVNFDNQLISNNTLTGTTTSEFRNGGKTRHLGAESTMVAHVGRAFRWPVSFDLTARYSWTQSQFSGGQYDGNFVPYSPQHTFLMRTDIEHRIGLGGQISWSYVSAQYADEFNIELPDSSGRAGKIPGYNILDLGLRYRHKPTGLSAYVSVKNALDSVYISSRLPNGIFTAGFRQIFGGIKWETL